MLRILLNNNDEIFINEELLLISSVKEIIIDFLDNNGDATCSYCEGIKSTTSSNNPTKAVVSIEVHSQSTYKQFIAVQDEITKAYNHLRKKYAHKLFNK